VQQGEIEMDSHLLGSVGGYAGAVSAVAIVLTFVWIVVRARTAFPILYRLWRWTHRRAPVKDPLLAKAIRARLDLVLFRYLFMPVAHIGQMRKVLSWAEKHDIDMGTLAECGAYFNAKTLTLKSKLPGRGWTYGGTIAFGFVLALCASFFVWIVVQTGAILIFKDDHRWFVLYNDQAQVVFPLDQPVALANECPALDPASDFSGAHAKSLCEKFADLHHVWFVHHTVFQQRVAAIFALLICLLVARDVWRSFIAARAAWAIREWLADRTKEPVEELRVDDLHIADA